MSRKVLLMAVLVLSVWGCLTKQSFGQSFFENLFDAVGDALGGERPAGQNARVLQEGDAANVVAEEAMVDVGPDFQNEFMPSLKQMLTIELYFARKIVHPEADVFEQLKQAGRLRIAQTAKQFEVAQRQGKATELWPDAREQLTDVLVAEIEKHVSAEMATLYRAEVEARRANQVDAGRGMMLNVLESTASLSAEQLTEVDGVLKENWHPKWSRNLMIYSYVQYLVLPDVSLFESVMTDVQRESFKHRQNMGTISFGWSTDLGLTPWENLGISGDFSPMEQWDGTAAAEVADPAAEGNTEPAVEVKE